MTEPMTNPPLNTNTNPPSNAKTNPPPNTNTNTPPNEWNNTRREKKKAVDIYTDGACSGNPGPGGWAAVLIYRGVKKEISGFEPETTNNRMELLAVIRALECLKEPCVATVYSDSSYLVNAYQKKWIVQWEKNNWRLADNKSETKNADLWRELDALVKTHDARFIKVAGHSDNEMNNRCDELAVSEITKNIKSEHNKPKNNKSEHSKSEHNKSETLV